MFRARLAIALLAALPALGRAQTTPWPGRPITVVVPFTTGTGPDILARTLGPRLSQRWGQPVIVDNKPGASGNIGADIVAKSAPNGYTLMSTINTFTMTPPLYKNLPYDPIADFAPVTLLATGSYALTLNPDSMQAKTVDELLATVRGRPGTSNYASPGNGTPHHLAMELFKQRLGLQIVHVPYKGLAGALTDLLSGQVQMMFGTVHSSLAQVRAGKLRALAVTGANRSTMLPEVPTFREQGIDFMDDVDAWYGVIAPAKTPREIIARIYGDFTAILALPEVRASLAGQGLVTARSSPGEFAALIRADLDRWRKVITDAKITAD